MTTPSRPQSGSHPDSGEAESDRRAQIEEIFDDALDMPRERRAAWLAARCGDDAALRGEVELPIPAASAVKIDGERAYRLHRRGVEVVTGRGYLEDAHNLRVETEHGQKFYRFEQAIMALGSKSAMPTALAPKELVSMMSAPAAR